MPIYEYICTKCGHAQEILQKMADAPLTNCPACSESSFKKMISAPQFRLSGSGWYETDFKSSNQKNLTGSDDKKPDTAKTPTPAADSKKQPETPKATTD